jgi:hypothetical protein
VLWRGADAGRGRHNLLAALGGLARAMVVQALEAVVRKCGALAVPSWPRGRLHDGLALRRAPGHPGRVLGGDHDDQGPGRIGPGLCPRSAIDPCAILQAVPLGGLTPRQARLLVVSEQAQHAQALGVACTRQGHGMDRAVDANAGPPGCQGSPLAIRHHDLRPREVGRSIRPTEGRGHGLMGDDGLRAGHGTPQHGERARVQCPPAPLGDHGPIDSDARAGVGREQDGPPLRGGPHALTLPQALTQR